MSRVEKLLRELIERPSVNPAFLAEGHPRAGEGRVADYVAETARKAGLDVELQPVLPERRNVLARLAPKGKICRRVLLAPHLDTVNGSEEQFIARQRGARLYGRGACDTKGSIAAMVAALCKMAANGPHPSQTEILFAGLVDEENGQAGSRAIVRSGVKADLAIVGEPTGLQIVTAHKGSMWLELETRGRSAHGSRPELGLNAVHVMARIVDALEGDYAKKLRRRPRHSLLGWPTISVGKIYGGTQPNIVPDRCRIEIDRRTLPGEREADVRQEIKRFLNDRGLPAVLGNGKAAPCLPMETASDLPMVADLMRTVSQRKPVGVRYFCDAGVLSHGGIPSVVFGPGDIAQAHTAQEWISLAALEKGEAMVLKMLQSLP